MKTLSVALILVGLTLSTTSFADVYTDGAMRIGDAFQDGVLSKAIDCEAMRLNVPYAQNAIGKPNGYFDLDRSGSVNPVEVLSLINWSNAYCGFSGAFTVIREELKPALAFIDPDGDREIKATELTLLQNRLRQLVLASKGMYSNSFNGRRNKREVVGSAYDLAKAFPEFDIVKDGVINEQDEFIVNRLVTALRRVSLIKK